MSLMRELKLRTSLTLLLVIAVTLTFAVIGSGILVYRLPQIEAQTRQHLQERAESNSRLLDHYTAGVESQIKTLARLPENKLRTELQFYLDAIVGEGEIFEAAFILDTNGRVEVLGLPSKSRQAAEELRGADFSKNHLFLAARSAAGKTGPSPVLWSDKYLSALSGKNTVGVALPFKNKIFIGEVSLERILNMFRTISSSSDDATSLVIDSQGQWLASSRVNPPGRYYNFAALPAFQAIVSGQALPEYEMFEGNRLLVGGVFSPNLHWVIGSVAPAGMGIESYRLTIGLVSIGFFGSLCISLLLAPLWASRIARPLKTLIERTHGIIEGDYGSPWPRKGAIAELNQLSQDIGHMVEAIQLREAEVVRSEERLRATLENTPSVAVQWYDANGRVLYWNKASEIMCGYSAEEALGSLITETPLMYRDQKQANDFVGALKAIDGSGQPYGPVEFALRRKDGTDLVALTTMFAIPGDGNGKIFVCMDVDVTERIHIEAALQDSETKLEAIFNASPAAMSVSDANDNYRALAVNAAWERQFDRQRQNVIGLDGREMSLWADPADRDRFFATLNKRGTVDDMEVDLLTGEGRRILCSVSAQITEIRGSRLLLMMTVDVTERRRIENEIRELNAELELRVARRTEELSGANDELATTLNNLLHAQKELVQTEKLASLGALVAGVAHELNTPLGNAVTVSSTLLDVQKSFSESMKISLTRSALNSFVDFVGEIGQILDRNLHRAADLVGGFKQLAVDQSSYQRRSFDLQEVVHEIVLAMGPAVRRSHLKVHNQVSEGFHLDSYPGPLGQVLMNLINNALIHAFKYQESGNIYIRSRLLEPGWIALDVGDDGCGISKEYQKRIFDPFFTTRLGQGGSGLGLHISFNLVVDLLGGRLEVTSAPGEGSIFHVRIPTVAPQPVVQENEFSATTNSDAV